ncbi:sensor histidine kinase [Priestia megaterium]|uniref:sensor histidine kinase n=1 Tax=Priestia megaterium TaxID=1404 RepID=UPI0036704023
MLILCLVSTIFAVISYNYDPKSPSIRWGVIVLSCAAMAGLSRASIETILPALDKYHMDFALIEFFLYFVRIITGFLSIYVFPYALLMWAITYSDKFNEKAVRICKCIFPIPIIFMLKTTVYYPDIIPDFHSMLYWAVPYIIAACLIHLYAWHTEKDADKKKQRITTISISFPVMLSALILNYIVRAINNYNQYWRYMIIFLILSFFIFLWKALKQEAGSLNGIKLRYEREAHKKTRQAINKGTALLSHAIKNQIYKINSSLMIINVNDLNTSSRGAIDIIARSSKHLTDIIERMHSKTQEIKIVKSKNDLNKLIDDSLLALKLDLHSKNIRVEKSYESKEHYVYCDPTETYEVFTNLLNNSIEAIETIRDKGEIKVSVYHKNSQNIIVSFADNGVGIPQEHLKHVTDPFFSTKENKDKNHGMGLNQCHEVMYKTGGDLKIESAINKGTTIKLTFPINLKKGDVHEESKSYPSSTY